MLSINRKFLCKYNREKVDKKLMNSLRIEGFKEGKIKEKLENIAKNSLKKK